MKKVKRWRYDCDFCKKTGGSGSHMKNHEKICTANPDRECGFCRITEEVQPNIKDLKKIIQENIVSVKNEHDDGEWSEFSGIFRDDNFMLWNRQKEAKEKKVLKELREAANDCPACILSAMRQTNTTLLFTSFDFKKEKKSMFDMCKEEPGDCY